MKPLVTPSDAQAEAIMLLGADLSDRDLVSSAAMVSSKLPESFGVGSALPRVLVGDDGTTVVSYPSAYRTVLRVTVWADDEGAAKDVAGVALGVLLAHTGDDAIRSVSPGFGPVPGVDADNGLDFATFTVNANVRPTPVG